MNTTELFLPSNGTSCSLPPLPEIRYLHTVNNDLLCGGSYTGTENSCLQWSTYPAGSWEELLTLDEGRECHVSWTPGASIGTYLIGGISSPSSLRSTTLITSKGTHEPGFPLKYLILLF